ncbi:MAG: hypothetical protein M1814_001610 [Vezdaea aestivalis]|nr:MAG: hypothetical protein M1814_001610 [Vezdaea aestivalis]
MTGKGTDLSRLLRPEIFHPLNYTDVPVPFRAQNAQQSGLEASPAQLATAGQFRRAAILAVHHLTTATHPLDHARIFELYYVRLSTLTLIGATVIAAHECKALEDINGSLYRDAQTGRNIMPWPLRVLAVRLQSIGFNEWRRGITTYFEMAAEAQHEIETGPKAHREHWDAALKDLGLKVGNALIEMGDPGAAARHLENMRQRSGGTLGTEADGSIRMRLALLYLRIGDIMAARKSFPQTTKQLEDYSESRITTALCSMSGGDYLAAVREWRRLADSTPHSKGREMIVQNLAVCLLYTGELAEASPFRSASSLIFLPTKADLRPQKARALLENLVNEGKAFHTLTFNLSTIYELCTEKSIERKEGLAAQVAGTAANGAGPSWEMSNQDFKM